MTKTSKLNKSAAQSALQRWLKQEGYSKTKSGRRLQVIAELMNEKGEINLQILVEELFEDVANPLNSISKLSKDIEQKADAAGFELKLIKDNFKQKALSERNLWLEGDNLQTDRILKEQEQATSQAESRIENLAKPMKPFFKLAVCYAQKEKKSKETLVEVLREHLGLYRKFDLLLEDFDKVDVGENRIEIIQKNLAEADFLLILESSTFHNDKDIRTHLLDRTFPIENPCIIAMADFSDTADRGKLNELHSFRMEKKGYDKVEGKKTSRNEFAQQLAAIISEKITSILERQTEQSSLDRIELKMYFDHKEIYIEGDAQKVDNMAALVQQEKQNNEHSEKAIDLLNSWIEKDEPTLFALLGQYGMGKTFTSRVFAKQQIQAFRDEKRLLLGYKNQGQKGIL